MFNEILYLSFLCVVVMYADYRMTGKHMGTLGNGIGAIPLVLKGEATLPSQYRVLVPCLCKLFVGVKNDWIEYVYCYMRIRSLSIIGALCVSYYWFSTTMTTPLLGISGLSLWFILAAVYDYTDTYLEIIFIALSLLFIGSEYSVAVIPLLMIPATLNKETSFLIPLLAFTCGEYWVALGALSVGLLVMTMIKVHYGGRKRYCSLFLIGSNIKTIKIFFRNVPILYNEYIFFFIMLIFSGIIYTIGFESLLPIDYVMGLFVIAMLVPSMWWEIRVFSPFMLTFIPLVGRVL